MSKERLETIKELVKKIESVLYDEWRRQELTFLIESLYYDDHVDWLIKQAELVGYFARKNGELNEFLNKYIEPKHLGKNVIDVAMDIIVKQSEHVQELEELVEGYKIELMIKDNAKKRARQQNKRYKQALEDIRNKAKEDYFKTDIYIMATEALEVGNND